MRVTYKEKCWTVVHLLASPRIKSQWDPSLLLTMFCLPGKSFLILYTWKLVEG